MMIDLPHLVRMVGSTAMVFYGLVAVVAIGFLLFDRPSKASRSAEVEKPSAQRAA